MGQGGVRMGGWGCRKRPQISLSFQSGVSTGLEVGL